MKLYRTLMEYYMEEERYNAYRKGIEDLERALLNDYGGGTEAMRKARAVPSFSCGSNAK